MPEKAKQTPPAKAKQTPKQPNILVIWGDDIGISNLSCYTKGLMGTKPPTSTASPQRA